MPLDQISWIFKEFFQRPQNQNLFKDFPTENQDFLRSFFQGLETKSLVLFLGKCKDFQAKNLIL